MYFQFTKPYVLRELNTKHCTTDYLVSYAISLIIDALGTFHFLLSYVSATSIPLTQVLNSPHLVYHESLRIQRHCRSANLNVINTPWL